jgi:UDP-N-acetylglucosamine 2-epimerase (non-hydrolysing)
MIAPRPGSVLCVVGARPNYMKMAPLLRALDAAPGAPPAVLVHTGQHYDPALTDRLFVMKRFEPLIDRHQPSCIIVVGDVNSTLACGLVASKRGVPLVHVEAGLRSYDRGMPEEINRVLTDQISDVLYTTEREAHGNLAREGIAGDRVVFVGNLMIDSLLDAVPRATMPRDVLRAGHSADPETVLGTGYALVTLHRPSNVDDPSVLAELVELLRSVSERVGLVWPMHPRASAQLERFGLMHRLAIPRIACIPPQGYLDMVGLMREARLVITDSGGVQEETTALGIPCLTLRENTERPITISHGTNRLMGRDAVAMHAAISEVFVAPRKALPPVEGWDGAAAGRLVTHLLGWLESRST